MRPPRRLVAAAVLGLVILAWPLVLRLLVLQERALPFSRTDARGYLADLLVAGLVVALALFARRLGRIAAGVVAVAWILLNGVNFEHVRVLDAACSFIYAGYLLDPIFLQGSALQVSRPVLLGACLALAGLAAFFWTGAPPRSRWTGPGTLAVAVVAGIVLSLWPLRRDQLPWRQDNFLLLNARDAWARLAVERAPMVHDSAALKKLFQPDLSGEPRVAPPAAGSRPNVLLILVEGLSGAYLPSFARYHRVRSQILAPKLDALGRRGLAFTSVIAPQRQTNRGEYAVLCGDYPKLVSEEARMTEYARGGTRTCLPALLREAGYRTEYIQSAPLGFMLKDQFMARAGFDRAVGGDFFTESYARSRWGVDDKAFFEQTVPEIRALAKGDAPWFATLLTVGTHHPFLVPKGFKARGDSHARAVAYADRAVASFIETLEAEGLLEDTLVIVTSDESAGLKSGDDVTRTLSQSWIPLVALVPGLEEPAKVTEPFSQSDLALSILDYLGLADRAPHFVGRSLFRTYAEPRPFYFSNTHLRRSWALEPSGILSHCTELLTGCQSYLVDPVRLFDPRRTRLAFRPELLTAWRVVVDHTSRSLEEEEEVAAPRRMPLVTRQTVRLGDDGREQLIFGGQYAQVPEGWQARVLLEVEVEGPREGGAFLSQPTYSAQGKHFTPAVPLLRTGDRARIAYDYVFDEPVHNLEVTLLARSAGGVPVTLRFHEAELVLEPAPEDAEKGVHNESVQVSRRPDSGVQHYSLKTPGFFNRGRCMSTGADEVQLEGKSCRSGILVYGPYAWAPPGATVTATFEVELLEGEAELRGEVVNDQGRHRLADAEGVALKAGERAVIEARFVADHKVESIEARLASKTKKGTTHLVVRSARLDVTL